MPMSNATENGRAMMCKRCVLALACVCLLCRGYSFVSLSFGTHTHAPRTYEYYTIVHLADNQSGLRCNYPLKYTILRSWYGVVGVCFECETMHVCA